MNTIVMHIQITLNTNSNERGSLELGAEAVVYYIVDGCVLTVGSLDQAIDLEHGQVLRVTLEHCVIMGVTHSHLHTGSHMHTHTHTHTGAGSEDSVNWVTFVY